MNMFKKLSAFFACLIILASCSKDMRSSAYVSSSSAGKVIMGKVLSARAVTIQDDDKNTLGTIGGAAAGGVAGSTIGKGDGETLAILGGAIAGAIAGNMLEDELGTSQGTEYIVKISPEYVADFKQMEKDRAQIDINRRRDNVSEELRNNVKSANIKSDIISVVQGNDALIPVGSNVYIIYNDDRPRLVLAN